MKTNKNTSKRIAAALGAISVAVAGSIVFLGAGTASAQDCAPTTDSYNTESTDTENSGTEGSESTDSESYEVENTC